MDLVHKSFAEVKELGDTGQLKAVISTFDNVDRDGDVMAAKAFNNSKGKSIPMVWSHNWDQPIGKGVVSVTPTEAIFDGEFFLDTEKGQEAYKTVKAMGSLQEFSIGFRIADQSLETRDTKRVRVINDLELFEASPVLVGAAYGTRTLGIKSMDEPVTVEKALETLKSTANLHTALKELSEAHDANCTDAECAFATKSIDPPQSSERTKVLQEISARVAKA